MTLVTRLDFRDVTIWSFLYFSRFYFSANSGRYSLFGRYSFPCDRCPSLCQHSQYLLSAFVMATTTPLHDGDRVYVVGRSIYARQAGIVMKVTAAKASVYFPLKQYTKNLNHASLTTDHPLLKNHIAYQALDSPPPRSTVPDTAIILPASVDAAILALCTALDESHLDADPNLLSHIGSRLSSSRRRS